MLRLGCVPHFVHHPGLEFLGNIRFNQTKTVHVGVIPVKPIRIFTRDVEGNNTFALQEQGAIGFICINRLAPESS